MASPPPADAGGRVPEVRFPEGGVAREDRILAIHTSVKGRARFRIPRLHRNPDLAAALEARLRGCRGIDGASANSWSATILIRYDPERRAASILPVLREALEAAASGAGAALPAVDEGRHSWWRLTVEESLRLLGVLPGRGLSEEEAAERRRLHGPNTLPAVPTRGDLAILADQFRSLPVLLLMGSAVLSVATAGFLDAALIAGVVAINGVIGFVTERASERTIQSLANYKRPPVPVRRAGAIAELPVVTLVPGDILLLLPGTVVGADARVVASHELALDESALTGESVPVPKHEGPLAAAAPPVADRTNMVFRGATVVSGNGLAVAVATGAETEFGRINALVASAERPQTPIQKQLDFLGRQLSYGSIGFCVLALGLGLWRGLGLVEMLRTTAALAVAALPEGLPTVATVTLALGIREMRRHNVLVRRLEAVETLGAVSVMCFDKTGTLTLNRMTVTTIVAGEAHFAVAEGRFVRGGEEVEADTHPELTQILKIAVLCNDSEIDAGTETVTLNGSSTENALLAPAIAAGIDIRALRRRHPRSFRRYRSETRRFMVTVHSTEDHAGGGGRLVAVKGSPNEVLDLCRWRLDETGARRPLGGGRRQAIREENEAMASAGLRVLGFAYAEEGAGEAEAFQDEMGNLVWLGLMAMADPARPDMRKLMAVFHQAGIRTVMVTGDQSATAHSVAGNLGLSGGKPAAVLDGMGIEEASPEELRERAPGINVFARVSPSHKLRIVRALQGGGHVVAMTGDGINDGPALRAADIGVAMGGTGTDAAREIADIVLADDDLQTMVVAVRHGRTIYRNIRKSVHFLVASNGSELILSLSALAVGAGRPLSAVQLLWLNLVTDVFPALALGVEPPEPDIMEVPPRAPESAIIGRQDCWRIGSESALIGFSALGAHLWGVARYGARGGGVGITALVLAQLLYAFTCRSRDPVLSGRKRLPPNPHLNRAVGGLVALQGAAALLPATRRILGIGPLGPLDMAVIGASATLPLLVTETMKLRRHEAKL